MVRVFNNNDISNNNNNNRKRIGQWSKESKERLSNSIRLSSRSLSHHHHEDVDCVDIDYDNDDDEVSKTPSSLEVTGSEDEDEDDYDDEDDEGIEVSSGIHSISNVSAGPILESSTGKGILGNGAAGGSSSTDRPPSEIFPGPAHENRAPLRVMFLSANTGGGHRASADALIHQVYDNYPGSTCEVFNLEEIMNIWPHTLLANNYNKMAARPNGWKAFYHFTNTQFSKRVANVYTLLRCETAYVRVIKRFRPDVIISVHPFLNYVPLLASRKAGDILHKHIPFYTVVTDLGSGHRHWFQKDIDRLYVASEQLRNLAIEQGPTPPDRVMLVGLPIRKDFTTVAKELGDRMSPDAKIYQHLLRLYTLKIPSDPDKPMILLMGGGDGVGSLWDIVVELYFSLVQKSIDATLCVVCGNNAKLKKKLVNADWNSVYKKRKGFDFNASLPPILKKYLYPEQEDGKNETEKKEGSVTVVPLGFVTRMAEYMAAANICITKAGPGTIAEAAALGLPVLLTSFLPGQEAGNVDFVIRGGFGQYREKTTDIALEVAQWLKHPDRLAAMSQNA